jgi:hypothetical protein
MKMNTCFLLGSGISRPAGLPSVDCITKQVLLPEHFFKHTDGTFMRVALQNQPNPISIEEQRRQMQDISGLLRWLKGLAELRFASDLKRSVNYEDLAYLATQIRDDAGDEYENPALVPLKCCVLNALPTLCFEQADKQQALGDFAAKTMNYISDVVEDMLNKPVQEHRWNYLKFFKEAVEDKRFDLVGLFTLNHDTLLETYLRKNEVQVIDGFDDENGLGIRRWKPALFDCWRNHADKLTVRLFKLHGSINWRRFRPNEMHSDAQLRNGWLEEYAGIRSDPDKLDKEKDERDRKHEVIGRPLFLAGTFNKMLGYLNHLFLELHYNFHRALQESERLFVCGYGFGDKGINSRIIEWICQFPATTVRRIVIVDPLPFKVFQENSRGAISRKLSSWEGNGQLNYLRCKFGNLNMTWGKVAGELLS